VRERLKGNRCEMSNHDVLKWYSPEDRVHVERHSRLSFQIGRFMGLRECDAQSLVQASLLHEFGRIGFSYSLRDQLTAVAKAYGFTEALSRTSSISRGLLPEWPGTDQVIESIEREIAKRAAELSASDPPRFAAFLRDASEIGLGPDGKLGDQQRRNLRILYGHERQTLANIRHMRQHIPFGVDCVLEILTELTLLLERKTPQHSDERNLLMATILLAADQVEVTNSCSRWLRSRRRPQPWRTLHLVNELVAGRDATLPSLHAVLVDRAGERSKPPARRVRDAVCHMVFGRDKPLVDVVEEARECQISELEWQEVAEWRERRICENGCYAPAKSVGGNCA
jgi:hypothetical protein